MKNKLAVFIVPLLIAALSMTFTENENTNKNREVSMDDSLKYEKLWSKTDELLKMGRPKSAAEVVDEIYEMAKENAHSGQFVKAVIYRMRVLSDYEEDYLQKAITDLQKEIKTTEPPVKQLLHSMMADLYWGYYQQNRHKILDRSEIVMQESKDIEDWSLSSFMQKIIAHYKASLENPEILKNTKIDQFDLILEEADSSEIYRPTLYDFLAHRAVDFFMNDENALNKPASVFLIDDEEYFAAAAKFAAMDLQSSDSLSMKFHALKIMQDLIVFHLQDEESAALIDVDLKRLDFVLQNAAGISKPDSLYLSALENLKDKYAKSPAVADVYYKMAAKFRELGSKYHPHNSPEYRWELKKAVELCREAISLFPDSRGAHNCRVIKEQIEKHSVRITTAGIEIPDQPIAALLSWKNSTGSNIKIIRASEEEFHEMQRSRRGKALIEFYARKEVFKSKSVELPDTEDYQEHASQIALPELPLGFYVLLISAEQNGEDSDPDKDKPDAYTTLRVSNISYMHNSPKDGSKEFYVLDRHSGKPMKNVMANIFRQEYNYRQKEISSKLIGQRESDKNGYFSIPFEMTDRKGFRVQFIAGEDTLNSPGNFRAYPRNRKQEMREKTHFFTDRAIYRPGQTVYIKGIMLESDGENHNILPKKTTEVRFYDVNGQEVSSLSLQSGDYGSFHGSFSIPTGVLTGQMRIGNKSGSVSFRVEEYKRPKFEVNFEPVKGSYKLRQEVEVEGKAMTFAGTPVDNAKVNYRVVRSVRLPYWRWWYSNIYPQSNETEIIHGITETNGSGEFSIAFNAVPDLSVQKRYDPVFTFTVYTDVTDINGETRSAETRVSVGEKALILETGLEEKVMQEKLKELEILATNLAGEKIPASGQIQIFRLDPPERVFRKRLWQRPDIFLLTKEEFYQKFPHDIYDNENMPSEWEKAEKVLDKPFNTAEESVIEFSDATSWETGTYLVQLSSRDAFGEKVEVKEYFSLFAKDASKVPGNEVLWMTSLSKSLQPGETAEVLFGSAADKVYALYELNSPEGEEKKEMIEIYNEQELFEIPVLESYRGNFGLSFSMVKFNRFYSASETIRVPFSNKELEVKLETFRDKMKPGSEEEWRIHIGGKDGDDVSAELLASMYDASLDAFVPHNWTFDLYQSTNYSGSWTAYANFSSESSSFYPSNAKWTGIKFQQYDELNWFGFRYGRYFARDYLMKSAAGLQMEGRELNEVTVTVTDQEQDSGMPPPKEEKDQPKAQAQPQIRKDFRETAFFYPALKTNENGDVIFSFTMPEALTRWKFMGLAHSKDLKTGQLEQEVVTQKKLMIMPNAPRFFRVDDTIAFSAKVVSMSDSSLKGKAKIQFFNALDMQPVDDELQLQNASKSFEVTSGESAALNWQIIIPEGLQAITYRITARAGNFSDGEEMAIPVLPNRMMVTESLPLPVRANETKDFRFEKLINSSGSPTLRNYRLTLEYTSNPAWYAVQALPYLMEYPYECSEQVLSRYYANSLATFIANSNPKIKRIFDAWRELSPDAFLSNLERNQELKAVMLEETPWVREAKSESERKKRIALLFDLNKMAHEQKEALIKLQQLQTPNGAWPWFKGMRESRYITQHIVSGLAHLDHLGVQEIRNDAKTWKMLKKAIGYLDAEIREDYEDLQKRTDSLQKDHLGHSQIQYLYARSYFTDELEVNSANKQAFDYYKAQADEYWLNKSIYMQGMIALALHRYGYKSTPHRVVTSLEEKALHSDEMGMYWRGGDGWLWYQADIERQALLIEAFYEITRNLEAVDEMKVWLLKQKQTQNWKSTKATAEAIYALLLRGTDILADDALVDISLGNKTIEPESGDGKSPQAGTGYFKKSWSGTEIEASMGEVQVSNPNDHIAWGALYWQYFQDLDKITPHKSPLSVEKKLFVERMGERGPVIEPLDDSNSLEVGDKVIVRISIRTDRDMEYVHLKDMRAAGFEPANVLSGYNRKGGLGYYESIRDASTNFFIDYLKKGSYVFEYPLIASQEGKFSNGITSIQCMYAPEFASHSEGVRLEIE